MTIIIVTKVKNVLSLENKGIPPSCILYSLPTFFNVKGPDFFISITKQYFIFLFILRILSNAALIFCLKYSSLYF